MADNKTPALVAVDDGFSQVKLIANKQRLLAQSVIRAGRHAEIALDGESGGGWYETSSNGVARSYTVGDSAQAEETRSAGFHLSEINRVLVHHALYEAGLAGRRVILAVGLPAGDFFRAGQPGSRNIDMIAKKKANLQVPVIRHAPTPLPPVEIMDVMVFAQGVSAWVDYAVRDDLAVTVDTKDPVGIIDIGGRTTDIAVVVDGQRIDPTRTGSENIGVLDVYDRVVDGVRERFGLTERLPRSRYEGAMRSGKLRLFGQEHDIGEILASAKALVEAKLQNFADAKLGSGADLSAVLLVGGGAGMFKSFVQRYPHGKALSDPLFANARGMWKYAQLKGAGNGK